MDLAVTFGLSAASDPGIGCESAAEAAFGSAKAEGAVDRPVTA